MSDISEFFGLMSELSGGFRSRAKSIGEMLTDNERTGYILVTDARAPERNDLLGFLDEIRDRGMRFDGFVINRVARHPSADVELPIELAGIEDWPAWRAALQRLVATSRVRADRQEAAVSRLVQAAGGAPAWRIPEIPGGVGDIGGLMDMAMHLPPLAESAKTS